MHEFKHWLPARSAGVQNASQVARVSVGEGTGGIFPVTLDGAGLMSGAGMVQLIAGILLDIRLPWLVLETVVRDLQATQLQTPAAQPRTVANAQVFQRRGYARQTGDGAAVRSAHLSPSARERRQAGSVSVVNEC